MTPDSQRTQGLSNQDVIGGGNTSKGSYGGGEFGGGITS